MLFPVSASAIFLRHQTLRWVLPVGVAGAIGLTATGAFSASASTNLPPRSAEQLLAEIASSNVDAMSGTIVANANLGLPQLPAVDQGSSTSMTSLLTGSHTVRIWVDGQDKQRVALLESVGETDVFRNGRDVWQWTSGTHTATHLQLPAGESHKATPAKPNALNLTPDQIAKQALAAIDPSTRVSTDANRRVADRAAYELVLTPRDTASRIGSVHIAIDGQHKIPIGVQIFARGDTTNPAIDVSFTQVSFAVPANENFVYTPPKGVTVKQEKLDASALRGSEHDAAEPAVIGTGWTTIVEMKSSHSAGAPSAPKNGQQSAQGMIDSATTPVSGAWGSGRLFQSKLITALFTNDGRTFAGAVDPSALYAAAASHR